MTLTVGQAKTHLRHALAGDPAQPYSGTSLVNMTGQWLVTAHPWEWLRAGEATLDRVANQDFIALPADLREITGIQPTEGRTRSFSMVSHDQLLLYRTEGTHSPLHSYGAVSHAPGTSGGPPSVTLELWPTPTEAAVGFYTISYRRDWAVVAKDDDRLTIPDWLEPLFIMAVRELARGLEEEDKSGVPAYARMDALTQSRMWRQATRRDGAIAPSLGQLQNGAAESPTLTWDDRWEWPSIPDPS